VDAVWEGGSGREAGPAEEEAEGVVRGCDWADMVGCRRVVM
jgi:hypothetical protein